MMNNTVPVCLVETTRGGIVESRHYGHYVVSDRKGNIQTSAGDPNLVTFPRSALKFIQAIELVESGAAQQFQLNSQQLALACASHQGEDFHLKAVSAWLQQIGCVSNDLICGADLPLDRAEMIKVLRQGQQANKVFHNCSGKHTGFLTVCRFHQYDIAHYDDFDHPAQKAYRHNLSLLTESDADELIWGIDGCALPAPALSLRAMAHASAQLAQPSALEASTRKAINTLFQAVIKSPEYLSGTDQVATQLTRITQGRIMSKIGAEGYFIAAIRDQGLGLALKISDGADRASGLALLSILKQLGALRPDEIKQLAPLIDLRVFDSRGREVGEIRPSSA